MFSDRGQGKDGGRGHVLEDIQGHVQSVHVLGPKEDLVLGLTVRVLDLKALHRGPDTTIGKEKTGTNEGKTEIRIKTAKEIKIKIGIKRRKEIKIRRETRERKPKRGLKKKIKMEVKMNLNLTMNVKLWMKIKMMTSELIIIVL